VTGEATVTSSDTSQTKPKAGTWRARFTVETSQKTETWVIEFGISDDGRRVATIQFAHYAGEMTPGTSVWLMAPNTVIENSSFPFSLMEYVGSSQRNHKGQVTFTSATTATGTIAIAGKDYQFTATP
jgi:hypothetical protein